MITGMITPKKMGTLGIQIYRSILAATNRHGKSRQFAEAD
jgi:hypothetical protein